MAAFEILIPSSPLYVDGGKRIWICEGDGGAAFGKREEKVFLEGAEEDEGIFSDGE